MNNHEGNNPNDSDIEIEAYKALTSLESFEDYTKLPKPIKSIIIRDALVSFMFVSTKGGIISPKLRTKMISTSKRTINTLAEKLNISDKEALQLCIYFFTKFIVTHGIEFSIKYNHSKISTSEKTADTEFPSEWLEDMWKINGDKERN